MTGNDRVGKSVKKAWSTCKVVVLLIKPEGDFKIQKSDLATERERHLTTARANQTISLTNDWAPEVEFSPYRALSRRQMTFPFCCLISLKTRRQRERLKNNRFNKQNNNYARAPHAFLYICLPFLHDYDVKFPISCFMEN